MSVLDGDRVHATLGRRLGDLFLKYAHEPSGDEAQTLLERIENYLAEVHRAASSRAGGSRVDVRLADNIAAACRRLLQRLPACSADGQAAIVGAARYFIDTHDGDRDDQARGFADDAEVVNYVQSFVAPELPRIPV